MNEEKWRKKKYHSDAGKRIDGQVKGFEGNP